MPRIDQFLRLMVQHKGSDLHLSVGSPPIIRQHGNLERVKFRELTEADMEGLMFEIMRADQKASFLETNDADFAYELEGVARFRINMFRQRKGIGAVMR
ncbi:MAG: type IV pili twitching motility protein PilT, partial [Gemmatimonadetes bacterium]|nr:type IV pili twitching motility protein PilT [Gemmatimonadota bacterium]